MLLQAIFEAVIRNWMGLDGRLRTLAFDMRSFATAGTTLTAHLEAPTTRPEEQWDPVALEIWIEADGKRAAVGTATVSTDGGRERP
jgi:hypothetical protein